VPASTSGGSLLAFSNCEACQRNTEYASHTEALQHLDSQHFHCEHPAKSNRPFDDPCFVWLKPSKQVGDNKEWDTLIPDVERFINRLLDIKKWTYELHCLVATPSPGERTAGSGSSLPIRLIYAFEEIMSMYIMMARELSVVNRFRGREHMAEYPFAKIEKMQERFHDTTQSAMLLLDESKTDIILLGTKPRIFNILALNTISSEFLVAALAINLQNRPILPDTSTGAIEIYNKYMSKLKYQASRRPQRRIFLDIHSLENSRPWPSS
jgi:hypothetical protein